MGEQQLLQRRLYGASAIQTGGNMGYRIIEMSKRPNHSLDGAVEVGVYDSAYHAMSVMKRAFQEQGKALHWYLVDWSGQVLAYPEDVYEAV